jgi:anti-sigma factor RsiW
MNCAEFEVLLHALIDGELDAGHAREVEAHAAGCSACSERLASFRAMHEAISGAALKESAPAHLRSRIEASLATPAKPNAAAQRFFRPSRRGFFGGFALGSALSAAVAASLVLAVMRDNQQQTIADEIVSAHIRSL